MSDKKYSSIQHDNAAGHVEFDGGKAVWQWDKNQNDSTSILIKSLDNPELALEQTQKTPMPGKPGAKPEQKPGQKSEAKRGSAARPGRTTQNRDEDDSVWQVSTSRGAGFDPYNRS